MTPIDEMIATIPVWVRLLFALPTAFGLAWGVWSTRHDFS
jgi:hypothetical protein